MPRFINKKDKKQDGKTILTKIKFPRLRGMRDILFNEYLHWDLVAKKAHDLANIYSFRTVKIPVLEKRELYGSFIGKKTDVFLKELYSFVDKGGDNVAMRPEATLGMARAYAEANLFDRPQPVKMFWLGPVFRHSSQSGAYRQFHQFNLEIFGEDSPTADVQLILIAYNFFRELRVNVEIQLNSVGCVECRSVYSEELKDFYLNKQKKTKLCAKCKKNINKNPLQILKCKDKKCSESVQEAPHIVDSICEECKNHFVKILEYLDDLDIPYNLTPFLTKEFDYYTKTIFAIYPASDNSQGRQHSLGGGGRYNDLIQKMAGISVPACGFAINLERTIAKVKENNIFLKSVNEKVIFLAQLGEKAKRKAFVLFEDLRRAGFSIAQSFTKDDLKSHLEEAKEMKVKLILILGQKEVVDKNILIRDTESGVQEIIDYDSIADELKKRLGSVNK